MSKKTAFLLAGPAIPGAAELHETLANRADLVEATGLTVPPVTQAELNDAAIEIRRTHKALGRDRKDVEGAWTRVVRTAEKTRSDVLIGQDAYAAATADQIALLLDALAGFRVHVVLTVPSGAAGIDDLIDPWVAAAKATRLHVLTLGEGDDLDGVLAEVARLADADRAYQRGKKLEKKRRLRNLPLRPVAA